MNDVNIFQMSTKSPTTPPPSLRSCPCRAPPGPSTPCSSSATTSSARATEWPTSTSKVVKSLKLGNVCFFRQLICRRTRNKNQLYKIPNIALLETSHTPSKWPSRASRTKGATSSPTPITTTTPIRSAGSSKSREEIQ